MDESCRWGVGPCDHSGTASHIELHSDFLLLWVRDGIGLGGFGLGLGLDKKESPSNYDLFIVNIVNNLLTNDKNISFLSVHSYHDWNKS